MPLTDDGYRELTEDEIFARLKTQFEQRFDKTVSPGDLIQEQLRAEAQVLAENQEQALNKVYKSAYLADATGKELDKVVEVIGLDRNNAVPATGVVRLYRERPPGTTYTIPRGSKVQTPGKNPVEFSLTERDRLAFIDGFESGDLLSWTKDTAAFSVLATEEMTDSYALEVPATNGVHIESENEYDVGTTFNFDIKPDVGTEKTFRFGVQDSSNYLECEFNENSQDLKLRLIEGGSKTSESINASATIPSGVKSHVELTWSLYGDTKVKLYESKARETELCAESLSESTKWKTGPVGFGSVNNNGTILVDDVSTRSVMMNVRAEKPGTAGNVGVGTIRNMPNGISGVTNVNNPVATGNRELLDASYTSMVVGEPEESDEDLRNRAYDSTAIGGAATVNAISTEISSVEGVDALTINRNRENSTVDGLPPRSFEAVVYGGDDQDVAEAIFQTASIDSYDVGGVNGTEKSYTITSDVTGDTETIKWSSPTRVNLNIDVELLVDDSFVGEAEIQSIIAKYIGGTDTDGTFEPGLTVGEDLYESVLKRKVVSPEETGVWEVNTLFIDSNNDGTDDTTTTASGAEVLAVADNEVAVTDARDGSITVTTSQK